MWVARVCWGEVSSCQDLVVTDGHNSNGKGIGNRTHLKQSNQRTMPRREQDLAVRAIPCQRRAGDLIDAVPWDVGAAVNTFNSVLECFSA
jgi:hypothetical protein